MEGADPPLHADTEACAEASCAGPDQAASTDASVALCWVCCAPTDHSASQCWLTSDLYRQCEDESRGRFNLGYMRVQAGRDLSAALMEGFLAASEAKDQDTFPFLLVSRTLGAASRSWSH